MKQYSAAVLLLLITALTHAQNCDSAKTREESKLWKGLLLDLGLNQTIKDAHSPFPRLNVWGSRGANLYYFWAIKLGKKFRFAPGIGSGFENYSFRDKNMRLSGSSQDSAILVSSINPNIDSKKSKLAVNYLDLPLELRFQSGRFKYREFRFAIGVKPGVLYAAHTKVKYALKDNDHERKEKLHENFGLQRFRFGLSARVGYSHFNFFGYYSLTPLFRKNKGPADVTPYMFGISITDLFSFRDMPLLRKRK